MNPVLMDLDVLLEICIQDAAKRMNMKSALKNANNALTVEKYVSGGALQPDGVEMVINTTPNR